MEQALAIRAHPITEHAMPLAGARQSGAPVPVFYLEPQQLTGPDPLSSAVQTNWVYPVMAGGEPGLVDIRPADNESVSEFGGIYYGLLARRVGESVQLAQLAVGENNMAFQLRLLQMPELDFAALWLKGRNEDYFISLFEGRPPGTATLQLQGDVLAELREQAAHRFASVDELDPDGTPTN
ncbi:hypothetical protein [Massilia aerilata]|uniref:Uncharacterized protein n=1 Tax=Massilia aerilata TaxID=453817 RepID=A0ABW0S3B5_9BURK